MPADRLKLAAVLELVDKFTKPARDMLGGANRLQKAIGASKDEWKKFDQQIKQVQHLKQLQTGLGKTGDMLHAASQRAEELKSKLDAVGDGKGAARLARSHAAAAAKVAKLTEAYNKQRGEYRQSAQAAREAGINTHKLTTEETRLANEAEKVNQRLDRQRERLKQVHRWSSRLGKTFGKLKSLGKWTLGAGIAGGAAAAPVVGGALRTVAEFEKYQAILETIEGSSDKAKASLSWSKEFAAQTPFELAQVTEAFVRLRAYGMDPTSGLLKTLGDTAASTGTDVMQAVEAIADAVTGENERLKQFQITASTKGDLVTYSYTDKAGVQRQMQVMKNDRAAIEKALRAIWSEKFDGGMEKQSKTWTGMTSNLMDRWAEFQVMVMESGPFQKLKSRLGEVLDMLQKMANNGELQAWAERIGEKLTRAFDAIWKFGSGVYEIGKAAYAVAAPIAAFMGGWDRFAWLLVAMKLSPLVGGIHGIGTAFSAAKVAMAGVKWAPMIAGAQKFGSALLLAGKAMLTNPIVLAAVAIAGAAYLIYRNWDGITGWFREVWASITSTAVDAWDTLKSLFFEWNPLGILIRRWDDFTAGLSALPAYMLDLGTRIVDGLTEGIRAKLNAAKEMITGLGDSIGNWFADKLGIHSPSRVFAGYGGNIAEGVGVGIRARERSALEAAGRLAGKLPKVMPAVLAAGVGAASPAFAGSATAGTAPVVMNIQITVNAAPGQSVEDIGLEVARQLNALQREGEARARSQLFDEV